MPVDSARISPLSFTKLVVDNLDKMAAFYEAVCGLVEESRAVEEIAGRPIEEVLFKADPPGTGSFVLTKFLDAPKRSNQDVVLGFTTDDVDALVERAQAAGGSVMQEAYSVPEQGFKVAFLTDIEGNIMEVVELL
jgi:lactoylglutathione lyase